MNWKHSIEIVGLGCDFNKIIGECIDEHLLFIHIYLSVNMLQSSVAYSSESFSSTFSGFSELKCLCYTHYLCLSTQAMLPEPEGAHK